MLSGATALRPPGGTPRAAPRRWPAGRRGRSTGAAAPPRPPPTPPAAATSAAPRCSGVQRWQVADDASPVRSTAALRRMASCGGAALHQQLGTPAPAASAGPRRRARRASANALAGMGLDLTGILQHADVAVAAAASASFKLLLLCALIAWMSHRNMLPQGTSKVLSQVGFTLTIPATLLTSTARVLAHPSSGLLLAVPVMAVLHIAAASLLGRAAAAAVTGQLRITRTLLGWKALHPTEAAAAIAASTAAALRAPQAAAALIATNQQPPTGLGQLVQLSCAFGNSVTLPLLYCSTLLASEPAQRAAAYISLFHAAWSPLLWVWGYGRLMAAAGAEGTGAASAASRARRPPGGGGGGGLAAAASALAAWVAGRFRGDGGGQRRAAAGGGGGGGASGGLGRLGPSPEVLVARQLSPAAAAAATGGGGAGRPVFAADVPGAEDPGSPAEALFRQLLRAARGAVNAALGPGGASRLRQALSPPVVAVAAGVVLGCSPLGSWLAAPQAAAADLPAWEAPLLLGVLRCAWETAELLASATLAVSALVLATSLSGPKDLGPPASSSPGSSGARRWGVVAGAPLSAPVEVVGQDGQVMAAGGGGVGGSLSEDDEEEGAEGGVVPPGALTTRARGAASPDDAGASVLDELRPRGAWEWRLLLAVGAVRFLAMPALTAALVAAGARLQLLPADPVCWFVLLLEGAMPPAQNLVLMMQLRSETAALGPAAARLLLQLYVAAVVPVTLWVSAIYPLVMMQR